MKTTLSWTNKLQISKKPEIKIVPINIAGMKAGEIMLVPSAHLIDDFIRQIPTGQFMDIPTLRKKLAQQYQAEVTCPITTGFHLRTVAEAAYEAFMAGVPMEQITPIWRVLDATAPTTQKLSYDPSFLYAERQKEGLPNPSGKSFQKYQSLKSTINLSPI